MFRLGLVTVCMYCWGTPGFDNWRPPVLEQPLKRFSSDVNELTGKTVEFARQLPYSPLGRQFVAYRQQTSEIIYSYFAK